MKINFKFFLFIAIFSSMLVQCKKDDEILSDATNDTTIVIDASSKTAWKYFSFEKGDTVAVSDPATSLNWDIAFKREQIKTNGGKNGSGQAAVFNSKLNGQAGFDALKLVPDTSVFVQDDSTLTSDNKGGTNLQVLNSVLNLWTYAWYNYSQSKLSSKNDIYIVKTASGKFAKLWIQSYYKNVTSGYYTIKYGYQKDGSRNLK